MIRYLVAIVSSSTVRFWLREVAKQHRTLITRDQPLVLDDEPLSLRDVRCEQRLGGFA